MIVAERVREIKRKSLLDGERNREKIEGIYLILTKKIGKRESAWDRVGKREILQ